MGGTSQVWSCESSPVWWWRRRSQAACGCFSVPGAGSGWSSAATAIEATGIAARIVRPRLAMSRCGGPSVVIEGPIVAHATMPTGRAGIDAGGEK